MPKLATYYRDHFPGPVTRALTWVQLRIFPSSFYRRRNRILRRLDVPPRVAQGPFKGMVFGPMGADRGLLSRLFGTYEMEAYPALERMIEAKPDRVVVAGAGDGYYAVGLARRLQGTSVIAFEGSKWSRYLAERTARRNGVAGRVHLLGWCDAKSLSQALEGAGHPLVICDIEGGEERVLDPVAVPALLDSTMLVELHPMHVDGIEEEIARRFAPSHEIEVARMGKRSAEDLPEELRAKLSDEEALWAIDETAVRGPVGIWMSLTPKNRAGR